MLQWFYASLYLPLIISVRVKRCEVEYVLDSIWFYICWERSFISP